MDNVEWKSHSLVPTHDQTVVPIDELPFNGDFNNCISLAMNGPDGVFMTDPFNKKPPFRSIEYINSVNTVIKNCIPRTVTSVTRSRAYVSETTKQLCLNYYKLVKPFFVSTKTAIHYKIGTISDDGTFTQTKGGCGMSIAMITYEFINMSENPNGVSIETQWYHEHDVMRIVTQTKYGSSMIEINPHAENTVTIISEIYTGCHTLTWLGEISDCHVHSFIMNYDDAIKCNIRSEWSKTTLMSFIRDERRALVGIVSTCDPSKVDDKPFLHVEYSQNIKFVCETEENYNEFMPKCTLLNTVVWNYMETELAR